MANFIVIILLASVLSAQNKKDASDEQERENKKVIYLIDSIVVENFDIMNLDASKIESISVQKSTPANGIDSIFIVTKKVEKK